MPAPAVAAAAGMSKAKVAAWVFAAASVALGTSVHRIQEGHVGVYYRGGALLPRLTEAGYRLKSPITRVEEVQITMQKVPQQPPQKQALRATVTAATARAQRKMMHT